MLEQIVNRSNLHFTADHQIERGSPKMSLPLPVPNEPLTPQTYEELIAAFFDRVRLATDLTAVNIAAGIAAEALLHLTT